MLLEARDPWTHRAGAGGTSGDLRRANSSAILRSLVERGATPRVDLASELGLSTAAVTRITADLIEYGILKEGAAVPSGGAGRRRVPVDLASTRFLTVGAHIGLKYTTAGLVDLRGRLVTDVEHAERGKRNPAAVADDLAQLVAKVTSGVEAHAQVVGIGVSVGGFVDPVSGRADHDALGWHDVDFRALFAERLNVPMTLESEVRALAKAEMWFGSARDVQNYVHILATNVFGAAVVVDRKLYDGLGAHAGGVAHLPVSVKAHKACGCGRNCLTAVAGADALIGHLRGLGITGVRSVEDIVDLCAKGDRVAGRALKRRIRAISEIVGLVTQMLAPEKIVIAGGSSLSAQDLDDIRRLAQGSAAPTADTLITSTSIGDGHAAGVVSSATPMLERFYADPLAHLAYIAANRAVS